MTRVTRGGEGVKTLTGWLRDVRISLMPRDTAEFTTAERNWRGVPSCKYQEGMKGMCLKPTGHFPNQRRSARARSSCLAEVRFERKRAGGQVRSPAETFLNRKQARGCLSELAYISQAKPETKGQESEGSSCYLVSLQPPGRKRGKWGICCPVLADG